MVSRIIHNVLLAWFLAVPHHCKLYMFRIWSACPKISPWDLIYWWGFYILYMFLSKFHHSVCFLWNLVWERKAFLEMWMGKKWYISELKEIKTNTFILHWTLFTKLSFELSIPTDVIITVSLNSANLKIFWIYFTMHTLQTEATFWDLCQQ